MDRDLQMETLLTKPYALIDILPKQVLPNFLEDFSKAEHFFLSRKERSRFAEKIVRIVLKLHCYFPIQIYCQEWLRHSKEKILAKQVRKIIVTKRGFCNLLLPREDTLVCIEGGQLWVTVYHPSPEVQDILSALAVSEGLFWRKEDCMKEMV